MKRAHAIIALTFSLAVASIFTGCQSKKKTSDAYADATLISLSDTAVTVEDSTNSQAVYTANDIVFYLEGQDFTYGEGTEADEHSQAEADEHTVVHITKPGTYRLQGSLSAGQIAVDLGEDAKEDPTAVVTLILDGVDIQCSVAPAIIFYNVYECGSDDTETATKDVDTSSAGANVIIADDSVNNINGSYVARIYESYELNEEGTEVIDSKKLHKYDAAFYSKRSMNVTGGEKGSGKLNIAAENEGLDSEMHLTINGGNIFIESGNDGINTNEDGISVTTINGGNLDIRVTGTTGEGDGIDSNGWLVINGGTVTAEACSLSGDAGIDSDMGIFINGGSVVATGNMLDRIDRSSQTHIVFTFDGKQTADTYYLKASSSEELIQFSSENSFSHLILSSPSLTPGDYTFWRGDTQLSGVSSNMAGGRMPGPNQQENMEVPEGMERPEMPEGMERPEMPEGMERPEMPEGMERPEMPEGMERPEMPEGMERPNADPTFSSASATNIFTIVTGENKFQIISNTKSNQL